MVLVNGILVNLLSLQINLISDPRDMVEKQIPNLPRMNMPRVKSEDGKIPLKIN